MERSDEHLQEEGKNSQPSNRWNKLLSAWRSKAATASAMHWVRQSRKQILMSVGGVVIITAAAWGGNAYVHANTVEYLEVYKGDQLIGTVSSQEDLNKLYEVRLQAMNEKYPNVHMKIDTSVIRTVDAAKFKEVPETEETLKKLETMIPAYAEGVELKVNDLVVGVVKDQDTADKLLLQVQELYNPDTKKGKEVKTLSANTRSNNATKVMSRVESVSLRERVAMTEKDTDPNKVLTEEEAMQMLTKGKEKIFEYTVQKGDTVYSIAKEHNVAMETIYKNNPDVQEQYLQIGQKLNLTESKPLLTVKTVETYTEFLVTEPQKEIRYDDSMRSGEVKVVREGKQGMKRMTYKLTKDNGNLTKEEWIDQEVITPAVSKIVIQGTKVVNGEGTGSFAYPVSGATLTSGFGERWGRMHKGIDLVSSDRTIMAADDGVVVFAGVKNGYGNTIIINHRNGYKTLYGHLNSIDVNVGDIVEKGQAIAVMGNTGDSTGTHLHFEIHKDDVIQNPLKYL
ncbi:peptidoglycan DD-metalloendopeptidase family protein [Paenibacillus sp. 1001270B_150601_E10]|uniref:peptidoglycan DD-metalloendopeptidase family protein n=1 Tax=Paenibacillus sp. 1001270B_150601_E10 TaxID=2787079 RepID=UPI00189F9849|nr:peptidoglycan DD-metalloendopeptidase family protein [Paenibacillus sp. 1001270B_150601_E10]